MSRVGGYQTVKTAVSTDGYTNHVFCDFILRLQGLNVLVWPSLVRVRFEERGHEVGDGVVAADAVHPDREHTYQGEAWG